MSKIKFLNAGYITLNPAMVAQIKALPDNAGGEVKFGYASGLGVVATVEVASSESLSHISATDDYKAKPLSVRGWEYEPKATGRDK